MANAHNFFIQTLAFTTHLCNIRYARKGLSKSERSDYLGEVLLYSSLHITVTSDDVLLYSLLCRRRWHLACLEDVWVSEQAMRCWDTGSSGWTDLMCLCLCRLMMEVCIYMYCWQGIYCTTDRVYTVLVHLCQYLLCVWMCFDWEGRTYIYIVLYCTRTICTCST